MLLIEYGAVTDNSRPGVNISTNGRVLAVIKLAVLHHLSQQYTDFNAARRPCAVLSKKSAG